MRLGGDDCATRHGEPVVPAPSVVAVVEDERFSLLDEARGEKPLDIRIEGSQGQPNVRAVDVATSVMMA